MIISQVNHDRGIEIMAKLEVVSGVLTRPTITVKHAAAMCGTVERLAAVLGVTPRSVFAWQRDKEGMLPPERYEQLYGLFSLKRWKPVEGEIPKLK